MHTSLVPNPANLSESDWIQIEKPLIRTDPILERFAKKIGATIWINYHGRPARDVVIESPNGTVRRIEIAPVWRDRVQGEVHIPIDFNYVVTIHAYWKEMPAMGQSKQMATLSKFPSAPSRINKLLRECWEKLEQISASEL